MLYCLSRNFFYICYIWKELIPYLLKQVLQKQYGSIGKIVLLKINSNQIELNLIEIGHLHVGVGHVIV